MALWWGYIRDKQEEAYHDKRNDNQRDDNES